MTWRTDLQGILDELVATGENLAECEGPIRDQYRATVDAVDAVRHLWIAIPDGEDCATDCADDVGNAATWLAETLVDEILEAIKPVDDLLDKSRELAEYVAELLPELGESLGGLSEADNHALRTARDLLRAMPLGAPE